ncbi:unnamed protein product, partial [Prorocentrum cordatum]
VLRDSRCVLRFESSSWLRLQGGECARCASAEMLASLRQVADQVFLKCMQLREIMGLFSSEVDRVELFTILCVRIVDIRPPLAARARPPPRWGRLGV